MDGARASDLYRTVACNTEYMKAMRQRVGGSPWYAWKLGARARVELPRVQILVVVANIQTRTLKTEVEKGSM